MKRRILCALSVLMMLCVLTITAYGVEVPDLSRTGSISVDMIYDGKAVPGGNLILYRVAEVHLENEADYSFVYTGDYADCQLSLDNLSASTTARDLADYTAEQSIQGVTIEIDDKGHAEFPDLELGLYLLVQDEAADGFHAVNPFLVTVPGRHGETYTYDVDASPKLDLHIVPTEIPEEYDEPTEPTTEPEEPDKDFEAPTEVPTEPEETIVDDEKPTEVPTEPEESVEAPTEAPSKLPQTGQYNWPVPILALAGIFLVVIGCSLRFSSRKKHYEE